MPSYTDYTRGLGFCVLLLSNDDDHHAGHSHQNDSHQDQYPRQEVRTTFLIPSNIMQDQFVNFCDYLFSLSYVDA